MTTAASPISQAFQGGSNSASAKSGDDIVSRDDFLRLLVAQLQHQDPMNPMQNQEFVAELATFSNLEQSTNQTRLLEQLLQMQQLNFGSQALTLIGKEASIAQNTVYFQPGEQIDFMFQTPSAGNFGVQAINESGQVVFSEIVSVSTAGEHPYVFSGINALGQELPPGVYTINIGASTDSEGGQFTLPTYLRGVVDGVNFIDGSPVLMVNGQPASMENVKAVYERRN